MTWSLDPFSDKHRLDYRSEKDRIGKPFYGSDLKRVIFHQPKKHYWQICLWRWLKGEK